MTGCIMLIADSTIWEDNFSAASIDSEYIISERVNSKLSFKSRFTIQFQVYDLLLNSTDIALTRWIPHLGF